MNVKLASLVFASLSCCGCYSFPRPMSMSGVIVDDATGSPVSNAKFEISRSIRTSYTENKYSYSAGYTSDNGSFRVSGIADSLSLWIQHPGYRNAQIGTSDGRSKHNIILRLIPITPTSAPTTQPTP